MSESVPDVFLAFVIVFIQCVVQLLPKVLRESKSIQYDRSAMSTGEADWLRQNCAHNRMATCSEFGSASM